MYDDTPLRYEEMPEYTSHVTDYLDEGQGVACFVVNVDGEPTVLYCSHRLSGQAEFISMSPSRHTRAAQAIAIQREARVQARNNGFFPEVD